MRRYSRNILQWYKNYMKGTKMINGDHFFHTLQARSMSKQASKLKNCNQVSASTSSGNQYSLSSLRKVIKIAKDINVELIPSKMYIKCFFLMLVLLRSPPKEDIVLGNLLCPLFQSTLHITITSLCLGVDTVWFSCLLLCAQNLLLSIASKI